MSTKIDYFNLEKFQKYIHLPVEHQTNPRFYCKACKEILIQPHQTVCGFRYCSKCTKCLLNKCMTFCPDCKEEIVSVKHHIMQDKAIEKELSNLYVKCINKKCNENVILKNLIEHSKVCEFRQINCQDCNELILFSEELHSQTICKNKLIKCDQCEMIMTRDKLERIHKNLKSTNQNELCEKWSSKCPYNCSDEIFKKIKSHLCVCANRPINCIFKEIGCNQTCNRNQLKDHAKNDEVYHLNLLVESFKNIRSKNIELKSEFIKLQNYYTSEIQNIKKLTLNVLEKVSIISNQFIGGKPNFESLKLDLKELSHQKLLQNNTLVSFPNQTDNISYPNSDSFIWRIIDVRKKIQNAKMGIDEKIVSDVFYSDLHRYKIKLRIYPNGDGIAKGKYLSVFFVILKGEFDENLSWPFSEKISFCVMKNEAEISSTKVIMKPDINEVCYGKPMTDSNIGVGQPEFIKIQDILTSEKYTNDGNLTIKFKYL